MKDGDKVITLYRHHSSIETTPLFFWAIGTLEVLNKRLVKGPAGFVYYLKDNEYVNGRTLVRGLENRIHHEDFSLYLYTEELEKTLIEQSQKLKECFSEIRKTIYKEYNSKEPLI